MLERVHDLFRLLPLSRSGASSSPRSCGGNSAAFGFWRRQAGRAGRAGREGQEGQAGQEAQAGKSRRQTISTIAIAALMPPACRLLPVLPVLPVLPLPPRPAPTIPPRVIASTDRISSRRASSSSPRSSTSSRIERPVLHRLLRDLGGRGVADVRAERGGGRGAAIEQLARARLVGDDAVDAPQAQRPASPRAGSSRRAARSTR